MQVNVDVTSGPAGGTQVPDLTTPLGNTSGTIPGVVTISAHPTDNRAVILTPPEAGMSNGGAQSINIDTSPNADVFLRIDVRTSVPPITRAVSFRSSGPVTP